MSVYQSWMWCLGVSYSYYCLLVIWSWPFWSWLDLIDPLISILLYEILMGKFFLTPFWNIILIHWVNNLIWDGAPLPNIWWNPMVRLLLSMCQYKLLWYCSDHVTHSPFDLKMTDMVPHSFCELFCAFIMEFKYWRLTRLAKGKV